MRRLSRLCMALVSLTMVGSASAGEPLPEAFPYVGGHFSHYQVEPDAFGDDFIDTAGLPGLQAGYRFPGEISAQVWWERNNARTEVSDTQLDVNLIMASLRFHAREQYLGVEPYAGIGAGELAFERGNNEFDESFMSIELGFQNRIRPHWLLDLGVRAPYSTDNERWDTEFYIGLNHMIGIDTGDAGRTKEEVPLVTPQPTLRDSDRDGVPDTIDECPGTPAGSRVTNTGCPADPATP